MLMIMPPISDEEYYGEHVHELSSMPLSKDEARQICTNCRKNPREENSALCLECVRKSGHDLTALHLLAILAALLLVTTILIAGFLYFIASLKG